MSLHIAIFARAPIIGQCKSRLARRLGAKAAARVQWQLLVKTVHAALDLPDSKVLLYGAPHCQHAAFWQLRLRHRLELRRQRGQTLGQRMFRALREQNRQPTLVVGTDCPTLSGNALRDAAIALATHDGVLIPALDGGYVLVGLQQPTSSLFSGIAWGGPRVLSATVSRARRRQLSLSLRPPLPDLDTVTDWRKARRNRIIAPLFHPASRGSNPAPIPDKNKIW